MPDRPGFRTASGRSDAALLRGTPLEPVVSAELLRVDSEVVGRLGPAGAVVVVASGRGRVLDGDVWVPVSAGDRVTLDPGASFALHPDDAGPLVAVLLRPAGPRSAAAA